MNKLACLLQVSAVCGSLSVAQLASAQQPAPVAEQPAAAPVAEQPVSAQPVAVQPVAAQPVAAQPVVVVQQEPEPALTRRELRRMPKTLSYREGEEIPEGYVVRETTRRGLISGGVAAIAAPYVVGVVMTAIFNFHNQGGWLTIPIAGPWITLAARSEPCGASTCVNTLNAEDDQRVRTFLILDGVVQGAGLALVIAGATWTRTELVRHDLANVWVAPTAFGHNGYGFAAGGSF
jgi:hypothetical protein